jgi:hypothetical protein
MKLWEIDADFKRERFYSPYFRAMAGVTGLEPATSGVTGRRSNQLSYTPTGAILRRTSLLSCPTVFAASLSFV